MEHQGIRLEEGRSYKFSIGKLMKVPGGSCHYVLGGPDGRKYLLPEAYYSGYGLSSKTEIICRVDRINCKGEVFLEPEHPFYCEGVRYTFRVSGFRKMPESKIRKGNVIIVETVNGEEVAVTLPPGIEVPEKDSLVELVVTKISKGRLYLASESECNSHQHINSHQELDLFIEGTEYDIDGEEYFIATDRWGISHAIMRRYYEHYGLKTGTTIKGRFVRYRNDGSSIIEPLNPFYKPGEIISLAIEENEMNSFDRTYYIRGKDKYGFTHELRINRQYEGSRLSCRIVMFTKGKPLLEPIF